MRPETIWQARQARATHQTRITHQAAIARTIGELAAMAMYLNGRSILTQRAAAAVIQSRVLRSFA